MLEPVKRINFDANKVRRVEQKSRNLSLGKQEKRKEGNSSPKKSFNVPESLQVSPIKLNEDIYFPQSAKMSMKNSFNAQSKQQNLLLSIDLQRNHSSQLNRSSTNNNTQSSQNNKKKNEICSPPNLQSSQIVGGGYHRKSQSTISFHLGSTKNQNQKIQKFNHEINTLQSQNSPPIMIQNMKNLFSTEQNFFSSNQSLHYQLNGNNNNNNNNNNIIKQNESPFFAFGNATQGITSEFGQKSLYINMPKTAGILGGSRKDYFGQRNSSSKLTQTYLDQYQQKAQLIDSAENKVYNIMEQKHGNMDNNSIGFFSEANYILQQSQYLQQRGKAKEIDSLNPQVLHATNPESYLLSSHNFYYFIIHIKAKQSPLKFSVKIKSPTEGYQNKLKGFISKTANRPNTFNSDDEFDGRSYKLYADGGKKMFNIDTVFVSLYPEIDMTVKIKIGFGEQKIQMNEAYILYKKQKQKQQEEYNQMIQQKQRERGQKIQEGINNSQMNQDFLSPFSSPVQSSVNLTLQNKANIQSIKERRILLNSCESKKRNRNITLFNKIHMPSMFDKYEKLYKQKEESEARKNEVQERKNLRLQEKCLDVEEKFRLSSIRSQFQIEKKKLVERISKFQLWQLVWIKFIKQVNVLQDIREKLQVKIRQKLVYHQAKFIAIRAIADWIKYLRRLGPYPEKRALNLSFIATNKFAQMISSKCNKKAENIICNYLQQSSKIIDIKSKGLSLINRVISIQRQWRETKQKKKRFKELIVRQFQSKYNEYLYEIRLEARRVKDPFYQPKNSGQNSIVKITDYVLLAQIVQNFLMQHLRRYYDLYETYRNSMKTLQQMSEELRKNLSISVAMKKPVFFRLPKDYQIKQMVKEYAEQKQLIN